MADRRLLKYIKEMLQKGYSAQIVKQQLAKSGYDSFEINRAFSETYGNEVKHVIHLSPLTIGVLIFIVAGVVAASYFIFSGEKSTGQLLDLSLQPVSASAPPGGEIIFIQELDNKGSEARFDVEIKHELIKSDDFTIAASKTETAAVETFGAKQIRFQVPEDVELGNYILRTTATYGGKKAIATLPVKIAEKRETAAAEPSCFDSIQNQNEEGIDCGGACNPCQKTTNCDDGNKCTSDFLENGRCANEPVTPCCGNNACERGEESSCAQDCKPKSPSMPEKTDYSKMSVFDALDKIKEKAAYDSAGAFEDCNAVFKSDGLKHSCYSNVAEASLDKSYCDKIGDKRIKDDCFSSLAKIRRESPICREVSDESKRDSCYLTFAIDYNDYSICAYVMNQQLRESCDSLRRFNR